MRFVILLVFYLYSIINIICANETVSKSVSLSEDVKIIELEEIQRMSIKEFLGRQLNSFWNYLINGNRDEPQSTFVGRCLGIAKRMREIMPMVMIGAGVIVTKLGFLVLFSLKTMGLLGMLLLLNVGTIAAKLGAFLASKKSDHIPQNLHVHVQPWKSSEIHESDHHYLKGPPYGFEDKISDFNIETHDLYNLYEKLKLEHNLRRYLNSNKNP